MGQQSPSSTPLLEAIHSAVEPHDIFKTIRHRTHSLFATGPAIQLPFMNARSAAVNAAGL
jgi:hypothetical protein